MSVVAISGATYASALRHELARLAQEYGKTLGAPFCLSYGEAPAVCYEPFADGTKHGNFIDASYRAMLANEKWAARFRKVHTHARRSLPLRADGTRAELDSCNSSDALLMNIFCFPRVLQRREVAGLLGVEPGAVPTFGFKARVPLKSGHFDRTEVDMLIGDLLVESKLTEADFQCAPVVTIEKYAALEEVFDWVTLSKLTDAKNNVSGYQLIRNVLAAFALNCSFCVIHDMRRPDLREQWFKVMQCVRRVDLRTRCKILTWQEVSLALSDKLSGFVRAKYGIMA